MVTWEGIYFSHFHRSLYLIELLPLKTNKLLVIKHSLPPLSLLVIPEDLWYEPQFTRIGSSSISKKKLVVPHRKDVCKMKPLIFSRYHVHLQYMFSFMTLKVKLSTPVKYWFAFKNDFFEKQKNLNWDSLTLKAILCLQGLLCHTILLD